MAVSLFSQSVSVRLRVLRGDEVLGDVCDAFVGRRPRPSRQAVHGGVGDSVTPSE